MTTNETRTGGPLVWHSSPSNRRDWMASDGQLCHVIVELADGSAVLSSVHAVLGGVRLPQVHCGSFSQAVALAVQRSTRPLDPRATLERAAAVQYLADCSTTGNGEHWYLSTACYHGQVDNNPDAHAHCRNAVNHAGEEKVPGSCKFCPARCVCVCHNEQEQR